MKKLFPELVRRLNRWSASPRLSVALAKRAARQMNEPPKTRSFDDVGGRLRFQLDLSQVRDRMMYLNAYEPVFTRLIRDLLRPGDVYVDVGASVGYFAAMAALKVGPSGRVYAFDAQAEHCRQIREHAAMNDLSNVEVLCMACWSEPGQLELNRFENAPITSASIGLRTDMRVAESVSVPAGRLDDVVDRPVKLLKIDVEGAEREALAGAERLLFGDRFPHLLTELNLRVTRPFGYAPMDLIDWLLAHRPGIRLHIVKARRRHPVSRERLASEIEAHPERMFNVWCESPDQ